jgi:hypothetical protein
MISRPSCSDQSQGQCSLQNVSISHSNLFYEDPLQQPQDKLALLRLLALLTTNLFTHICTLHISDVTVQKLFQTVDVSINDYIYKLLWKSQVMELLFSAYNVHQLISNLWHVFTSITTSEWWGTNIHNNCPNFIYTSRSNKHKLNSYCFTDS